MLRGRREKLSELNTKQIDYILELTATLNFNRVEENLFISQTKLTYQISAFE